MDFEWTEVQRAWREKAKALGRELAEDAAAGDVVMGAARVGIIDPTADLLAAALAVEALACESAAAGMTLALHTTTLKGHLAQSSLVDSLARGEVVGALVLSSEDVPSIEDGLLSGRASWVGPITERGIALVGARHDAHVMACGVRLDDRRVHVTEVKTSALRGFVWAYLTFSGAPCVGADETTSIMARARTLIAGVALGICNRALRESLAVVRREHGAGGEQTV